MDSLLLFNCRMQLQVHMKTMFVVHLWVVTNGPNEHLDFLTTGSNRHDAVSQNRLRPESNWETGKQPVVSGSHGSKAAKTVR